MDEALFLFRAFNQRESNPACGQLAAGNTPEKRMTRKDRANIFTEFLRRYSAVVYTNSVINCGCQSPKSRAYEPAVVKSPYSTGAAPKPSSGGVL